MKEIRQQITIRPSAELVMALKELALTRNTTLSDTCVGLLEAGLRRETTLAGTTYLTPEIEHILATRLKAMENRFANLIVHAAMEAGTAKRLLLHLLVVSNINTQEEARDAHDTSWRLAHKALKKPLDGIEELVAALRSEEEV